MTPCRPVQIFTLSLLALNKKYSFWTFPFFMRLVAGFTPRTPIFSSRTTPVGFVVDEVELGSVYTRAPLFSPLSCHSTVALYLSVHHLARWTVGPLKTLCHSVNSNSHNRYFWTKRLGPVASTPVSFLGSLGFKYRLAERFADFNFSWFF